VGRGITIKTKSEEQLAFYNLGENQYFKALVAWLENTKKEGEKKYLWASEPEKTLWQGRLQMITEILDEKDSALEKLKKSNQ